MFKSMSIFFDDVFQNICELSEKDLVLNNVSLVLLEKWKRSRDRGKASGALLTDLSKAFSCLNYDLLIVTLTT